MMAYPPASLRSRWQRPSLRQCLVCVAMTIVNDQDAVGQAFTATTLVGRRQQNNVLETTPVRDARGRHSFVTPTLVLFSTRRSSMGSGSDQKKQYNRLGKTGRSRSRLLKSTSKYRVGLQQQRQEQQHRNERRKSNPSLGKVRSTNAGVRPLLVDYEMNRQVSTQQDRLNGSIGCEHFDNQCSGCSVNRFVGNVDRVLAAKRYFASPAIQRKRLDLFQSQQMRKTGENAAASRTDGRSSNFLQDNDYFNSRQDDDFFQLVLPSKLTGWRTQAKLVVAPKCSRWRRGGGCMFGLYLRGTHQVFPIPNCAVHHPSINRAVSLLEKATAMVGTPAFEDETNEGGLRYVQLQVDRVSGGICLTLVWNAENLKQTHPALTLLKKQLIKLDRSLWHSIWCHCNDSLGNNIFHRSPQRWHRLTGHEYIREPIPIGDHGYFFFSPLTFRQGNMDGFDILALDVAAAIPGNSKVCELYAGVGVLGLTALVYHHNAGEPLQWIRCSDSNPANPRCFARSVETLPNHIVRTHVSNHNSCNNNNNIKGKKDTTLAEFLEIVQRGEEPDVLGATRTPGEKIADDGEPRTQYMVASAADALLRSGQALGANVLVVDPPRKGLEEEVLNELCKPFDPSQPYVESSSLLSIPDAKINWANDVNTLIYVSCGFDPLARDSEKLLNSRGGWLLKSATGYVLFPGSDHVETVCVFQRK